MPREIVPINVGLSPIVHSSLAVRAGQLLFVSGLLGISPRSSRLTQRFQDVDERGRGFASGMMSVDAWLEALGSQAWQSFSNLGAVLEAGGSSLGQIVRLNYFSRAMYHHHLANAIRSKTFHPTPSPPNTGCQVLAMPAGALFQISAVSLLPPDERQGWDRRIVNSRAAAPVSHYDLGVQVGPLLVTGDLVPASQEEQRVIRRYDDVKDFPRDLRPAGLAREAGEETIRAQTWFLYDAIRAVLEENQASLRDVVKLTVYLVDTRDLAAFAEVHAAAFREHAPVVMLTTVETLGRPEFRVAIEVNALVPEAGAPSPRFLQVEPGLALLPSTSAGVSAGGYIFLEGLAGLDERSGQPVQGYGDLPTGAVQPTGAFGVDAAAGPTVAQTWSAIQRGRRLLEQADASLDDIVALHVNLTDMRDLPAVDGVLRSLFPADPPAVTVIQGRGAAVPDARVELEITAYTG
ncbi:MAG: hypothetical protein IT307_18520 [Chloroflexi bacterium]|nr:hypothetical protein [Chloroflexota bacterium]